MVASLEHWSLLSAVLWYLGTCILSVFFFFSSLENVKGLRFISLKRQASIYKPREAGCSGFQHIAKSTTNTEVITYDAWSIFPYYGL